MKKSTVAHCIIIVGLLGLSVLTLLAVYATGPEAPVLLLEETFSDLDETKWTHQVSECREEGDHFRYYKTDGDNGLTADGVLHFHQPTSDGLKFKRAAPTQCTACLNCSSPIFSADLETRNGFEARSGKVEIRAQFRKGDSTRFRIGLVSNKTEISNRFPVKGSQMEVSFESAAEGTLLKSPIPDDAFHVYEIEWNPDSATLKVDDKMADEKQRNATAETRQPFHLKLGFDLGGTISGGSEANSTSDYMEVDYVRLFKLGD